MTKSRNELGRPAIRALRNCVTEPRCLAARCLQRFGAQVQPIGASGLNGEETGVGFRTGDELLRAFLVGVRGEIRLHREQQLLPFGNAARDFQRRAHESDRCPCRRLWRAEGVRQLPFCLRDERLTVSVRSARLPGRAGWRFMKATIFRNRTL